MHIAYIVPNIETRGGVERVLSKKANYFIEKFGYKISIITFSKNSLNKTFFEFNNKINLYSLVLSQVFKHNFINYVTCFR